MAYIVMAHAEGLHSYGTCRRQGVERHIGYCILVLAYIVMAHAEGPHSYGTCRRQGVERPDGRVCRHMHRHAGRQVVQTGVKK